MKAYVVSNTEDGIRSVDGTFYLITEKGEVLASHWCSHKGFAFSDLYAGRPERIEKFTEQFGKLDVFYLGEDDMTMEKLIELNKKYVDEVEDNNR